MSTPLHYIKRPATAAQNKVIPLFLVHGYGSDENDLFSFAASFPSHYFIISVRAPYAMQPYGNAWYAINFDAEKGKWSDIEQAKNSRDLLHLFIQNKCDQYQLDQTKICVLGFSQGSILSYGLAFKYPEYYHKFICLSGYINDEISEISSNRGAYKKIKVFASHGSQDQVIPLEWAQSIPDQLNAVGIDNTFKQYPVGHGVSPQNFTDLIAWLEA